MANAFTLREDFINKWRLPPGASGLDVMAKDLDNLILAVRRETIVDMKKPILDALANAVDNLAATPVLWRT